MTQAQALDILKTGANVFLTGEPGAGKTHTINEYVRYLREYDVEVAITASTGIAATHIGGMTIHSWSGIGIRRSLGAHDLDSIGSNEYVVRRIRRARVLVIDEISMLPPETLSMIDAICREVMQNPDPFGGLQVIFVGDFFQLPPVQAEKEMGVIDSMFGEATGRFAFESSAWKRATPLVCYLSEQHRQDDDVFLSILSAIRSNTFGDEHLSHISARRIEGSAVPSNVPKLFSHNFDVNLVNDDMLSKIPATREEFVMLTEGPDALTMALKKGCLSPEKLSLKVGAEVMFTKNNPKEHFANGTLGTVVGFETGTKYPIVRTRDERRIIVEPMDWVIEENGKIKAKVTQLPLRLAWAITIHKSQGMSMDEAVIDLAEVFEYGQGYVALSRVRRLSGMYLLGWNERTFQVDAQVFAKDALFREASDEAQEAFRALDAKELAVMQRNFIIASGGSIKATAKEKKGDTKDATLALWNEGKTIREIAKIRNLKEKTIFDHIETLVEEKRILPDELLRLVSEKLAKALPEIHKAFGKEEKLTPVYEKFGGKYSYDELRIARMLRDK